MTATLARPGDTPADTTTAAVLDDILARGDVHAVYQPVVDLASGATVAVEALARGPRGPLAAPDALFAAARRHGRLAELDALCQTAAVAGACRSALGVPLFVNVEAEVLERGLREPARTSAMLGGRVPLVMEITERALTARPAELIDFLARVRSMGWGIALDDVGVNPCSLALLPIVRPDIVKLDRSLVQGAQGADAAAILTAVAAECERSGAVIVGEGIENDRHRDRALAAGATLGQGYHLGRPGPLAPGLRGSWLPPRIAELHAPSDLSTPYTVVAPARPVRRAGWRFLLEVSATLETHGRAQGAEALVVSAFQDAGRFTALTAERYRALARDAAFVAALGVGMPAEPTPGVRGARLRPDDPLRGEWSVVVLGPHFAGALVAREIASASARPDFTYAVTYDRDLVACAATALLRQIARADIG